MEIYLCCVFSNSAPVCVVFFESFGLFFLGFLRVVCEFLVICFWASLKDLHLRLTLFGNVCFHWLPHACKSVGTPTPSTEGRWWSERERHGYDRGVWVARHLPLAVVGGGKDLYIWIWGPKDRVPQKTF